MCELSLFQTGSSRSPMNGSWRLGSEVEDCFDAFRGRDPFVVRAEQRRWSGIGLRSSQPSWVCRSLRRMTYAGPAPVCVIPQAAKWNKSNFCWVTFRCKQRRTILAASSDYAELSTTGSVLSPPRDHLDG